MNARSAIAVAIVNHNTCNHLRRCLQSISVRNGVDVIVVDNASTDGSVEMVRATYPGVHLLVNNLNVGYGAAANQALASTEAAYVLLLNSDTRLQANTLDVLQTYLDEHPRAAIAGPRLVNDDGSLQPSCYPFPRPLPLLLQESGLERLLARMPLLGRRYLRTWAHDRPRAVPWLLGAALAIRRAPFQAIGGFDASYYMYLEETDLCYRLQKQGWEVHFTPQTTVVHRGGASTDQRRAEMRVAFFRSMKRFYQRHYGRMRRRLLPLLFKLLVLARLARDLVRLHRAQPAHDQHALHADVSAWRQILTEPAASGETPHFTRHDVEESAARAGAQRMDWRFLLPHREGGAFDHLFMPGASPQSRRRVVQAGVARRVSDARQAAFDAAVVLDGAGVSVAQAAAALQPGGVLYFEVDRRRPGQRRLSPGRMAKQLARHGLKPLAFYWVMPDFRQRKRYIPLDTPQAFRWYVQTLFLAGRPLQRLAQVVLRLYSRVQGPRFAPLAYCYAVVASSAASSPYLPSVFGDEDFPLPRPRGLRPAMITSGQDAGSRVVLLPFIPTMVGPSYVLKIAALPELNANTEREQLSLRRLHAVLDPDTRRSIPTPKGVFQYEGLAVSAESCAPGRPLHISTGRWGASPRQQIDDLQLGARWLASFHRSTGRRQPWDDAAIERWIDRPQREFACVFDAGAAERTLFARTRARAAALRGTFLPLVRMHYDFGPWNLYRAEQALSVTDWEFGRDWEQDRCGPPLCDLLYLTNYWVHLVCRLEGEKAELQGLYDFFIAPDFTRPRVRAAHEVLARYMQRLDIDRRFLPILLVYTWVEQSLHQQRRRETLGRLDAQVPAANRCASYVRLLAQHQEALFAWT